MAIDIAPTRATGGVRRRRRAVRLTVRDRITVGLMVGVPMVVVGGLVWFPTIASILLSFTSWDGFGGVNNIHWIGTRNYDQIVHIYPPFLPAFRHNLYWPPLLSVGATPVRLPLAHQPHQPSRRSPLYQS